MTFFPAHEMHGFALDPKDQRPRLYASLAVLATHAGLILILLLGVARQVVVPQEKEPPVVMADLSSKPVPVPDVAPPVPKVKPATVTAMVPDITVQPETRVAPQPTPAPAAQTSPASSTLASAPSMAPSGTSAGSGASAGAAAGGGGGGYDINPYLARVAAHIQMFLRYPTGAGRMGTGIVRIHLVFLPDGTVVRADIYGSSGNPVLDTAALNAVLRAKPVPPFPPELKLDHINGVIPILLERR